MKCSKFAQQMGRLQNRFGHSTSALQKALSKMAREVGAAHIITNGKITGYRMRDGSVVCAKRRYRDKVAADVDMARIAHISTRSHVPVRSYRCPNCRGFHLTSNA
jgi:hypothetical protein